MNRLLHQRFLGAYRFNNLWNGIPDSVLAADRVGSAGFQVRRKTQRKRSMAKLTAVAKELRSRRHQTIHEQGQWLGALLKAYYAYFAVPMSIASLRAMLTTHVSTRSMSETPARAGHRATAMDRHLCR